MLSEQSLDQVLSIQNFQQGQSNAQSGVLSAEQAYSIMMDTSELGMRRFQRDPHQVLMAILESPDYSRLTLENARDERIGHYRASLFRSAASSNPSEGIRHLYEQPSVVSDVSSKVVSLSDYARRDAYIGKMN